MRERVLATAAVAAVLAAYCFYGSLGTWRFPLGEWGQSYYAGLAEGFLHGKLSMAAVPDPALTRLANPYDFDARGDVPVLWDASYFEGKYYLYFSPVPALLFYAPVRLVFGAYPSDALAATFFASIGFLFLAALIWRARPKQLPAWLWILFAGVGNLIPFVITRVLFYMVAAACGLAFTAAWAWAVVRFRESPSMRWAVAMGAFLAMAIATRPNLIVLVVFVPLVARRRFALAVLAPLALVACAMLAYNYARFRDVREFGVSYQMARTPMQGRRLCGICGPGEIPRLVNHAAHYVFWPPAFLSQSPHAFVQNHRLDPAVAYPGDAEPVAGLAPVTPLALLASFFALLVPWRRDGPLFLAAAWLVLLALSSCWWVTARYTLDFLPLLLAGTVLCVEDAVATRAGRVACIVLAIYSIVLGALLPFQRF
jgi:hypothetical protein